MNIKPIFVASLIFGLTACTPSLCPTAFNRCAPPPKHDCTPCEPQPCNSCEDTGASMAEASYAVSRSIVDLAETEQAASPYDKLDAPPNPASYGMSQLTSMDWSGPIEPLIRQIAKASGYRVQVLGTAPAIPVLVTVYDKNIMLGEALRNIGYQAGRRASVAVFPDSRTIELRYAKN